MSESSYLSITKCITCDASQQKRVLVIEDHLVSHEVFHLEECTRCKFRYISNPPTEDLAYKYYETDEYVEHSDSSDGIVNTIYHYARRWMIRHKHGLLKAEGRTMKLLDFGTGTGYFINAMRDFGYDVMGVEISPKARAFCKSSFNLDVRDPQDIFKDDFPSGFGYITFWHVLEHVYDPEKSLKRLGDLLEDDGVLVIALPNYRCVEAHTYGSYWNGYDVPRHIWHWDKESFTRFAENCGYRVKKTKILPLDPFYNCLISESYRKKKWAYLLIPFIGMWSLIKGLASNREASSIIYFLEKST